MGISRAPYGRKYWNIRSNLSILQKGVEAETGMPVARNLLVEDAA
jgi:hypothetical protein